MPDIHGKKISLCVWWNSERLVNFKVGQTVNANLYKVRLSRVDQSLYRQEVEMASIKILYDKPHTAKTTHEKIDELG